MYIELGNVYSKVEGASIKGTRRAIKALSVRTPGCEFTPSYRQGHWDGMTHFYQKRKSKDKFPTGLLFKVFKALKDAGDFVEILDDRKNIIDIDLPGEIILNDNKKGNITLRDYQYEAVCSAIQATRGVINVATNGGKTEIACGIIQQILPHLKEGQHIAFFTHSKEIFSQSVDRLEERLQIRIGKIGSGMWDIQPVTVVMIPTIAKHLKAPTKETLKTNARLVKKCNEINDEISLLTIKCANLPEGREKTIYETDIYELQKEKKYYEKKQQTSAITKHTQIMNFLEYTVMFIGDEVHHASSDTWYKVFMELDNAYLRFGLTGTVDESNPINLMRLIGCTGRIITKVSNDFLIEKGYSAKPVIYMMSLPTKEKVLTPFYADARKQGIIHCDIRNLTFIKKIVERANSGKQCLVIVNEVEHGTIVYDTLIQYTDSVQFIHGQKGKERIQFLEEFKKGQLNILISTSILDEGVDVSGINCLFLMSGGKSMRQLLQRIGRGLRKKEDNSCLEVYDTLDYHNSYLTEHTLERYNTYKSEGFEIRKI